MLQDGLLQAVLLVGGAFRKGEVAVGDKARGAVDLREQVGLAQRAIGGHHPRPMQGITHPEIAGVFGQEGASLGEASAQRPGGQVMSPEQAMDGGAMQSARATIWARSSMRMMRRMERRGRSRLTRRICSAISAEMARLWPRSARSWGKRAWKPPRR